MILYLTATAAVLALALPVRSRQEREALCVKAPQGMVSRRALLSGVALVCIFAILFGLLALRLNVGNDYAKYVEFMHLARFGGYVPTEVGFNFLAWAAYRIFAEENFLFCFGVIAFITVLCFLLAIDALAERFFVSFAMFMLLGFYFRSFNTVRYYLALSVTTWAIVYLLRRDYPKFVLLVLLAACFHKSALVVLLFYPVAALRFKRWFYPALAAGGCMGLLLRAQVMRVMLFLYPSYQETSLAAGGEGSKLSILRCVLMLALIFAADRESLLLPPEGQKSTPALGPRRNASAFPSAPSGRKPEWHPASGLRGGLSGIPAQTEDLRSRARGFYCHCNVLAAVLYLFFFYLPVVSRIGYYLTVTQIFYVPMLIGRLPTGIKRRAAAGAAALFCILFFAYTMRHAGDDGFRILPYQTFLFHEMPPILSDTGY